MNMLPIEIENSIWKLYYMNKFKSVINEFQNYLQHIDYVNDSIEEVKKYIRSYRFTREIDDTIHAKSLFISCNIMLQQVYTNKAYTLLHPSIKKTIEKGRQFKNKIPPHFRYISYIMLANCNYNKKATIMLHKLFALFN